MGYTAFSGLAFGIRPSKKGDRPLCSVNNNTFICVNEDKSVIASDRRESGNLIEKECISITTSFHSRRLPRFARNDIQKVLPNY